MADNSLQSSARLNVDAALVKLANSIEPISKTETLETPDSQGRILVDDIHAPMNLPPFESSAMDGYAVRYKDLVTGCRLTVQGTSAAGHPYPHVLKAQHCVRIFTGAQMPENADTVLLQENVRRLDSCIEIGIPAEPTDNVRQIGHDVARGNRLLRTAERINHFSLAWLTACGISQVNVFTKPTVAIFSTGDELKNSGEPLLPGQIYDANRAAIKSLVRNLPIDIVDLGIIADNQDQIEETIAQAAITADAIITSGGVSVGDADFVRQAIDSQGSIEFWKLNLKPGKPFAYGRVKSRVKGPNDNDCYFFGLPGNPISTIITLLLLVKPALQQLCGGALQMPKTIPAVAEDVFHHTPGRDEYQRGRYVNSTLTGETKLSVVSTGDQSSNRFASFNTADCLVWIDKNSGSIKPGEIVKTLSLTELIND